MWAGSTVHARKRTRRGLSPDVLAVAQNAVDAITAIKASSDEVPEDARLRIFAGFSAEQEEEATLQLALVTDPEAADVVVEAEGEQVFLEPEVALLLDDKVLDAQLDERGGVNFAIAPQPGMDGSPPS